jgi:hypothetical protein
MNSDAAVGTSAARCGFKPGQKTREIEIEIKHLIFVSGTLSVLDMGVAQAGPCDTTDERRRRWTNSRQHRSDERQWGSNQQ